MDSSLICGIITKLYKKYNKSKKLKTFGIGIKGSTDLEYSQKADFIDSERCNVECSEEDFINAIPDVIKCIESAMIQLQLEQVLVII